MAVAVTTVTRCVAQVGLCNGWMQKRLVTEMHGGYRNECMLISSNAGQSGSAAVWSESR